MTPQTKSYIGYNDAPDRPYHGEPDDCAWSHTGIRCRIRRVKSETCFHLCGYVLLPPAVILHVDVEEIAEVHWGITGGWTDKDGVWVGFDCAHCDDVASTYDLGRQGKIYRDFAWVEAETEALAAQVAAWDAGLCTLRWRVIRCARWVITKLERPFAAVSP